MAQAIAGAAALAWGGMVIHNLADLPQLRLGSRENLLPGAAWLLLVGLWAALPRLRWPATLLWEWGLLNLVGGALSVLPLPLWPYAPEQSLRHYLFHGLYAVTQIPLLLVVRSDLRARRAPLPLSAARGG